MRVKSTHLGSYRKSSSLQQRAPVYTAARTWLGLVLRISSTENPTSTPFKFPAKVPGQAIMLPCRPTRRMIHSTYVALPRHLLETHPAGWTGLTSPKPNSTYRSLQCFNLCMGTTCGLRHAIHQYSFQDSNKHLAMMARWGCQDPSRKR